MALRIWPLSPPLTAALLLSLLLHATLLAWRDWQARGGAAAAPAALHVSLRIAAPPAARTTPAAPAPPASTPEPLPATPATPPPALSAPAVTRPERRHTPPPVAVDVPAEPEPTAAAPAATEAAATRAAGAWRGSGWSQQGADPLPAEPQLGALLQAAIQRQLRYPEAARQQGLQGMARLRFTLTPEGDIEDIALLAGSGAPELDAAAIETIRALAPFAPARGVLTAPRVFEAPIGFRLDAR